MITKHLKLLSYGITLLFLSSACNEDSLSDFQSNDRQILSLGMEGQIGNSTIQSVDDDAGIIEVVYIEAQTDLSSVSPQVIVSEFSTISPASGEIVEINQEDLTFSYLVTSQSGKTRRWTVHLIPYTSPLDGDWALKNELVYDWHIGRNETWGWGVFGDYDADTGYDPANYVPESLSNDIPDAAMETDNTIRFTSLRINEKGNPEGVFFHGPGEDENYAPFVLNPDRFGSSTDYSYKFRTLPSGEGLWELNENAQTITLWNANKDEDSKYEAQLVRNTSNDIRLVFNIWIDEYTWDHNGVESHLESAITFYYDLQKQFNN